MVKLCRWGMGAFQRLFRKTKTKFLTQLGHSLKNSLGYNGSVIILMSTRGKLIANVGLKKYIFHASPQYFQPTIIFPGTVLISWLVSPALETVVWRVSFFHSDIKPKLQLLRDTILWYKTPPTFSTKTGRGPAVCCLFIAGNKCKAVSDANPSRLKVRPVHPRWPGHL